MAASIRVLGVVVVPELWFLSSFCGSGGASVLLQSHTAVLSSHIKSCITVVNKLFFRNYEILILQYGKYGMLLWQ